MGTSPLTPYIQVTPLLYACSIQAWDIALLLLSKGADTNKAATYEAGNEYTPLIFAIKYGSIDICRSLLESGARQDSGPFGGFKEVRRAHLPFLPSGHTAALRLLD